MTIIVGYFDSPSHITVIGDTYLGFGKQGGYDKQQKIYKLKVSFDIPELSGDPSTAFEEPMIDNFKEYKCKEILVSFAGSNILANNILNKIRNLLNRGLVVNKFGEFVRHGDWKAPRKWDRSSYGLDGLEKVDYEKVKYRLVSWEDFKDYPKLTLKEISKYIKEIIEEETKKYANELLPTFADFTKVSCQVGLYGLENLCENFGKNEAKIYEFLPVFHGDIDSISIEVNVLEFPNISILGSLPKDIKNNLKAKYFSLIEKECDLKILLNEIKENIEKNKWKEYNIGGNACICSI